MERPLVRVLILALIVLFVVLLLGGIPGVTLPAAAQQHQPGVSGHHELTLESPDQALVKAFEWGRKQALAYASDSDPVGPWYEAALPGREAFCMRDVAHQCMGGHALGLARHNKNMLRFFAASISDAKDWCSYWEINRFGKPAPIDYESDARFWYNLPANFDILDACYRMYLWSDDPDYIQDPAFLEFYRRTLNDYVERWDLGLDTVMSRQRILNIRGRVDTSAKFQVNRGIPGYDEGERGYVVAFDVFASHYAALRGYSRILLARREHDSAREFDRRAKQMLAFIDDKWWDASNRGYFRLLNAEHKLVSGGASTGALYWRVAEGEKAIAIRDALLAELSVGRRMSIEGQSHLPEVLYRVAASKEAYEQILDIAREDKPRREYPEAPFAVVGAIVTGLMGVDIETLGLEDAIRQGGHHERRLVTRSQLIDATPRVRLAHLPVIANVVSVTHTGRTESEILNEAGPSFIWKATFYGNQEVLQVNGQPAKATNGKDLTGNDICWVNVVVGSGESAKVALP